jgi:hypothetical protein
MPSRALTPTPKTYAQLRDAVIAVAIKGRREIDPAKRSALEAEAIKQGGK